MLQSLLIDQPVSSSSPSPSPSPPFHPDYSNWSFGRPRIMSGKESTASQQLRRSPIAAYAPPPISMAESLVPRHSYEPAVPRSYSHSPSNAPAAGEVPELQPWLFQIFPDPYTAETGAPVGYSVPVDHHNPQHPQYMHGGDGSMVYAHGRTQSYEERLHGSHRTDQPFYDSYQDGARTQHGLERDHPKRSKHSQIPEYDDSSSSEGDVREWRSAPSRSDYSRSPQLATHSPNPSGHSPRLPAHSPHSSHASTARSSPTIGGYSPDLNGSSAHRRNPSGSYSHLVAQFPGPARTKVRKVRRKLEPREREQVHQLRKIGACTKCWGLKMKCDDGSPCKRCEKTGAGALCVRVHFVDLDVFSKWLVDSYSRTMMHHTLRFTSAPPRAVTISHEKSLGVTLPVTVYEFTPTAADQLEYWYKDAAGWQSMPTTPYAMKRGLNTDILEKYIQDHTYFFVDTAFRGNHIMSEIFLAAFKYARSPENFLLRDALQLWTATQLLIQGASLHPASDGLGVHPIPSPSSPQAGQAPLPRALSNQIDHLLERRIWQLEKQILSELQKRIFGRKREDWLKIFFTMVVLMNALERDSWRLYYWIFHMEDGYMWRHPTSPKKLIEKNDVLAESLAAHFAAISKGLTPFALDWSREQTMGLLGSCEDPEGVLGAMERIGRNLRNPDHTLYISNIFSAYRQDDQRSLDFLYSSKVMIV